MAPSLLSFGETLWVLTLTNTDAACLDSTLLHDPITSQVYQKPHSSLYFQSFTVPVTFLFSPSIPGLYVRLLELLQ